MRFHFDQALSILGRTLPYVFLRLAVYGLAIVLSILWFGALWLSFENWPFSIPAWIVWPVGGGAYAVFAKLVRNYVLYLVKAAHIAVITHLVVEGDLPAGSGQISFGVQRVLQQFIRVSVYFAVDRLVHRVVRAFNRSVFKLLSFLPAAGMLRNFSQRVLDYSAGYVDEAVLSYSMVRPSQNPWSSAREGVVLYVQNWRTILASGFFLALISYGVVLLVAAPGIVASFVAVEPMRQILWAASFGLGLLVKFVFMDPFALTSVIVNYHRAIQGQTADRRWESELDQISGHFREFSKKAESWTSTRSTPPVASGARPVEPVDIQ